MNDTIKLINNENYGAPELKRAYQGYTLKGFLIAITIHIALIGGYMLSAYLNMAKSNDIPKNPNNPLIFVKIEDPPPLDDNFIPPKENYNTPEKNKDLSSLQPVPTRKDIADDVVLKTQDELNKIINSTSRDSDSILYYSDNGKMNIDNSIVETKIRKDPAPDPLDQVYKDIDVEHAPECTNLEQVKASMKYPEVAIEGGIEGRVSVQVLVGKEGQVIKIGKMYGPDIFYDEVKDKITNLQFTAGLQNNQPVKVWITVPFNFRLK